MAVGAVDLQLGRAAFAIPADEACTLGFVQIRIIAADASVGLLGLNLIRDERGESDDVP